MRRKLIDTLHELLTNQVFIIAGAIVLFLLVNALLGPRNIGPVHGQLWA